MRPASNFSFIQLSNSCGSSMSPTTGDDTPILTWLTLLLMSGACLVVLMRNKRLS